MKWKLGLEGKQVICAGIGLASFALFLSCGFLVAVALLTGLEMKYVVLMSSFGSLGGLLVAVVWDKSISRRMTEKRIREDALILKAQSLVDQQREEGE